MPLSEYNLERFFHPTENKEKELERGSDKEPNLDKSIAKSREAEVKKKKVKPIEPAEAHRVAIQLLVNARFARLLKSFVGELIVHRQNVTRLDFAIGESGDEQLLRLYGLTAEHFRDLTNGNLNSFELKPDGEDLALYFKSNSGEPAIRPLDDSKLAEMLNIIFRALPDLAPPEFQSDVAVK